jgi:hypothetical protein
MPVPNHFGLGRSLLGVSLLSLLCILKLDGTADKNRNCQRSQHQALWDAMRAVLLKTVPHESEMETPAHIQKCISQLLNIDSSHQGLGPNWKWRQLH